MLLNMFMFIGHTVNLDNNPGLTVHYFCSKSFFGGLIFGEDYFWKKVKKVGTIVSSTCIMESMISVLC